MVTYLMLGSNMGDRAGYLEQSITLLSRDAGKVICKSAVYESEPWGFDSMWFLNQAVALETKLEAKDLLIVLQAIELSLGRIREPEEGYQPRTIDIDIIFLGDQVIHTDNLVIPHPRIAERMFVLAPLSEIAPTLIHPLLHHSVQYLKMHTEDKKLVRKLQS